jgi:carbonic anhydrase
MQKLIQGIHKFQNEVFDSKIELFKKLEKGQHPQVLFITCSDSRINPNLITQTEPGDLFIIRNAGNLIPTYGSQAASGETATIEFALDGLGVKDIIVCGHSHCGAMKGLLQPNIVEKLPAMKAWLQNAETTKRIVFDHYKHLEGDNLLMATIEENVLMQIENLKTHPTVATRLSRKEIKIHGWVYKFETGMVFKYEEESGQFVPLVMAKSFETAQSTNI